LFRKSRYTRFRVSTLRLRTLAALLARLLALATVLVHLLSARLLLLRTVAVLRIFLGLLLLLLLLLVGLIGVCHRKSPERRNHSARTCQQLPCPAALLLAL